MADTKESGHFLENTKVRAVHGRFRGKVITIDSSAEPLAAFQKLVEHGILSAPVKDVATKKWCGFLDVRDLVAFCISCYEHEEKREQQLRAARERSGSNTNLAATAAAAGSTVPLPRSGSPVRGVSPARRGSSPARGPPSRGSSPNRLSPRGGTNSGEFLKAVLSFEANESMPGNDPTRDVTVKYLAARNRYMPIGPDESLDKLAHILATGGVARVPVVDEEGNILDIISQSAVISFLHKNESKLGAVMHKTLEELGIARKPVISVRDTDPALAAFRIINARGLKGLAVVDKDGKVIANTSASDLKLFIQNPSFRILRLSVLEYLNIIRRQSLKEGVPIVTVKPTATLGKAIGKLAATGMHRLFVVDEQYRPVGVLSLTDILRHFIRYKDAETRAESPAAAMTVAVTPSTSA